MNRIINKYGALRHDSPAAEAVEACLAEYERKMREIIRFHKLTPAEIRCVASYTPCVFAEETLIQAIQMRKAERAAKTPATEDCGLSSGGVAFKPATKPLNVCQSCGAPLIIVHGDTWQTCNC